ncbi:MAG: ribulokinase [Tenericutes bacterium]|nr:ribulokinase [Mycoplasmatota bacterium]
MKLTIGLDFGTLSVRAVLVDISSGEIIASSVSKYRNAVMDSYLVNGIKLPNDYALQNALDYIESMETVINKITSNNTINNKDIIGIGVDFTASTILPMKADGTPLSALSKYENNPHAYSKLWKHHSAEKQAVRISELAIKSEAPWIKRYGNKISSEWMLPKVLEILEEDLKLFNETDYFVEAGDFITYYLTKSFKRSSCQAGYKGIWHSKSGYPKDEYLVKLNKKLKDIYNTKLSGDILPIGKKSGRLTSELANKYGLKQIPVSVSVIDAHVAAPACQAVNSGDMLMIIGTSSCDIVLSEKEVNIPGIQGVVKDGAIPNLFAYESGQPAVGDIFSWYIENHLPSGYYAYAKGNNQNIYQYMEDRIKLIPKTKPRLLALDWWNGNRSVLVDPDLSGILVGYNLQTTPEDIYRALIEATAFGKRVTIEAYESNGIEVKRLIACGGLATKNKYLLQCYANILKRPVFFTEEEYAPALGAAIFGALAAKDNGGYSSIEVASKYMSKLVEEPILPNKDFNYDELFKMYIELHDYFGKHSKLMKKLKLLQ